MSGTTRLAGVIVAAAVCLALCGCPEPEATVPDCSGMTLAEAGAALDEAGLVIGEVTEQFSETVPAGLVMGQDPAAGETVEQDSAVDLVVSKGLEPVVVPDVVGMEQSAAEAAVIAAGLNVGVVSEAYSDSVPAGSVISQDPAEGTSVAPGTAVAFVVSQGPAPVAVPDLVGMTQAAAETAIAAAGFTVGAVTTAFSDTVPLGEVISQDPAAGQPVAPGAAVDLVVSGGPEPVSVPDVSGMTVAAATSALTDVGLAVGTITEVFSDTVDAGLVISQTPAAGSAVAGGTAVNLTVSKGPAPVAVPSVVGVARVDAEAAIAFTGLLVGDVTEEYSVEVPAGFVISQDPAPGTMVSVGSAVDLVVSKGDMPFTFDDPNLEGAVREAIGKPAGDLLPADVAGLLYLDASGLGIASLDGIEHCTSLWFLDISYNQISDLGPLAGLVNLTDLYIRENLVTDLGPVSGLTNLHILVVPSNQISDLGPVASLTHLTVLAVYDNQIDDLTPISGLTDLIEINAYDNLITHTWPLAALVNLQVLTLGENQISDISGVASMTNLMALNLNGNPVSNLAPLEDLTSLIQFEAQRANIADLEPLAGLTNLITLGLSRNDITDISPLAGLANLEYLNLDHNQISDVTPVTGLTGLQYLVLSSNQIASIKPIVDNPGIGDGDSLSLNSNPLGQIALCIDIPALEARNVDVQFDAVCTGEIEVPDVVGMTRAGAETAIENAGLAVGTVTEAYDEIVPAGQVVSQNPAAGAIAQLGDLVDFTVSLGCQPILFPDPELDGTVRAAIHKPSGAIYRSDLVGLTSLNLTNSDVSDLTGIEYCTDLVELILYRTQVSDISPVAGLTNLIWLYVALSPLSDISPVAGLTNLKHLGVYNDQITDITPVAGLTNLEGLRLEQNQITDISAVANLVKLQSISLDDNQVSDISVLAGLPDLRYIYMDRNQVTSVTPIMGLMDLVYIRFYGNPLDQRSVCVEMPLLESRGVDVWYDTPCMPISVPDLAGMSSADAQAAITTANLTVGTITEAYSETIPVGEVLVQDPAAGASVEWGSAVNITMSLGPEPLTFPDPWFELAVRCELDKPEGPVYRSDMATLTSLDGSGNPVSDLTGIEYCTNLAYIEFNDCELTDLSPLAGLVSLVEIHLRQNEIAGLNPLAGLINLRVLDLDHNLVSDLTPLAGLTSLENLNLFGNQISDLSGLENLTALTTLVLGGNPLTDLSLLAGLTNLECLHLAMCQITDVTPLAGLTNLTYLCIEKNQVSDLGPLAGLVNLIELDIADNPVTDLTPLAGMTALTRLVGGNNQISDLTPIQGLTNLQGLYFDTNQIDDLQPLAALTQLQYVFLRNNLISDVDPLSGLPALLMIKLTNNQITDLGPLAANLGFGSGDSLDVTDNPLDQESLCQDIPDIQDRGATVVFAGTCEPVTVPDVIGMTQSGAAATIAAAHLTVGTVAEQYSETIPAGDVISQDPAGGDSAAWGSAVDLTVSLGPQPVTFPDWNFEIVIRNSLAREEGPIYCSDMATITRLNWPSSFVSDIAGIEHCVNLTFLDLSGGHIADISPLAGLVHLETVYLHVNEITDLGPLAGLVNVRFLNLNWNQIDDLTPLADLTSLEELQLYGNQIGDLSGLENLNDLMFLDLSYNPLSDLGPLAGLASISQLNAYMCQISDLTPLAGLTSLTLLYLDVNEISDLTPLAGLVNLTSLGLSENLISDVAPLASLPAIKSLGLSMNRT